ncbi:T9SS type A sorting domain-containing protein [Flavobacterium sp.]|uniref:T9SS type A sorting domain-containing protein n=1 Tax=Flavobacterium sp. TaxID=239 RepID=UPI003B9A1D20
MKKITLTVLFLCAFAWSSIAQVQVGSGNNQLQNVPIEPYYNFSYSQSIYLASEINATGQITGIQYYYSGTTSLESSQEWVVYLKTSDRTSFADATDWEDIATFTQVYSGVFPVTAPGWYTINFDVPFDYNGTDNLIVAVEENQDDFDGFSDDFWNSPVTGNRSIYAYSDDLNIDPTNPTDVPDGADVFTGVAAFVPNIIFEGIQQACATPGGLTVNGVTSTSATVTWNAGDQSNWEIFVVPASEPAPTEADAGVAVSGTAQYAASNLTATTTYNVYVRAVCSGGLLSTWSSAVTFTTTIDCSAATEIEACGEEVSYTLAAGNGTLNVEACGFDTPGQEKLYVFTPEITGIYELQVTAATGGYVDYFFKPVEGATCDANGWECIDDINAAATAEIGFLTGGVSYFILVDAESTTAKSQTFNIVCAPACTAPQAQFVSEANCAENEEFFVFVEVDFLGTATGATVTDDQGSPAQTIIGLGELEFGPYPIGTEVIFTVANDQDETCFNAYDAITVASCPPANDECENAISLTVGGAIEEQPVDVANAGATDSEQAEPTTCFGYDGGDIWYVLEVPASGSVTIQTGNSSTGGTGIDTVITAYTGTCDALTQISCDDDGVPGFADGYSRVVLSGRTPGELIYLRVYEYNNDAVGTFSISAFDASLLSVGDENIQKSAVYPNPVKDTLTVSNQDIISNISVFNIVGQQVLLQNVNNSEARVDFSSLAAGTYLLKVQAGNSVETIKIVKN